TEEFCSVVLCGYFSSIFLFSPPSASLPVTSDETKFKTYPIVLDGLSQYSAFSRFTRSSATSGSSLPFGNQILNSGFQSSSILFRSRMSCAAPLRDTYCWLSGSAKLTFTFGRFAISVTLCEDALVKNQRSPSASMSPFTG